MVAGQSTRTAQAGHWRLWMPSLVNTAPQPRQLRILLRRRTLRIVADLARCASYPAGFDAARLRFPWSSSPVFME
jgi:hypothetical protein